ncbi:MAG: hypothetical protein ACYDD2_02100 [Candidatus Acidiferrales bacterium]
MWVSKDLGVVQIESLGPDGKPATLTTLGNVDKVTLGKPDPKVFVPPAYSKYKAGFEAPCN